MHASSLPWTANLERFAAGSGVPGLEVRNPATDEIALVVAAESLEDVDRKIASARNAFDHGPWPRMTTEERLQAISRFSDAVLARHDDFRNAAILETGVPWQMITGGLQLVESVCRGYPDLYRSLPQWEANEVPPEVMLRSAAQASFRFYEPVGVVSAISPYNFPIVISLWKIIPALAAGCTVILRTSPITPLEGLLIGEAARAADFPPGVFDIVIEKGAEGGVMMSSDPRVDLVSFTGSTSVGRQIVGQAASTMKRLVLELGGKSVQLHLDDAFDDDFRNVVRSGMTVFGSHAGQACSAQTRMLVPNRRKAAVLEALKAGLAHVAIGDPREKTTVMGPVISHRQLQSIDGLVQRGIAAGARLIAGGGPVPGLERGSFYAPTILDIDSNKNPVAQEEAFGPVLSVQGYETVEEAIAIANDSDYGLGGAIYTADPAGALPIAAAIRTGTVQINTGLVSPYTPLTPHKQSGLGSERGVGGIRAFQQVKHIVGGRLQ